MDVQEIKDDLIQHLSQFNIFDLERLRQCFEFELKCHEENKDDIQDILNHIDLSIENYRKNKQGEQ